MCSRVTLDGNVIEECVNAGDGKFKEGAWVKISEDYENHPERQQLAKFVGKYGRLTRRYHGCVAVLRGRLPHARAAVFACTSAVDGRTAVDSEMPRHRCWCIKWLERDEAIAQVRSRVLASSRPPARVLADCDAVVAGPSSTDAWECGAGAREERTEQRSLGACKVGPRVP